MRGEPGGSVVALLAALGEPETAELAAGRLEAHLRGAAERLTAAELAELAALHDRNRRFDSGLEGPLPVAALRRRARAEISRRGGEGWRPLASRTEGLACVGVLEGHECEVRRLVEPEKGLLLSDAAEPTRILWELGAASERARPPADDGFGDGWWLRRGPSSRARAIDFAARQPPRELSLPAGSVAAVAGGRLALLEGASDAAAVAVWEIASGSRLFRRDGYAWDHRSGDGIELVLSPRGRLLGVATDYASSLQLFEVDGGIELASFGSAATPGQSARLAALAPEPLALLCFADRVELHDLARGQLRRFAGAASTAALDPAGERVAVAAAGRLEAWSAAGRSLWSAALPGAIDRLAFAARGGVLGALVRGEWEESERGYRSAVHLFDESGRTCATVTGAHSFSLLTGEADLATGGRWGTIWLWRLTR